MTDVYSEKGRLRSDDLAAQEARLRKMREVLADRRRYLEILA